MPRERNAADSLCTGCRTGNDGFGFNRRPKDKEATSEGNIEGLTCFQKGQPVFKAQDRVREFVATSSMPLVAEVSLGQVRETRVRLYASEHADVVCVTTNKD
jgi:hypothetical protein